jgi:hypothetical protein
VPATGGRREHTGTAPAATPCPSPYTALRHWRSRTACRRCRCTSTGTGCKSRPRENTTPVKTTNSTGS